jgi:hypothetical protein
MITFENDLYINCDTLIIEANILYNIIKINGYLNLHKDDIFYIDTMNNYINNYFLFKKKQIIQYIDDLIEYNNNLFL